MGHVHDRVFITGGSGGIGSACVAELTAEGAAVCAPSRADCDVRLPGDLARAFSVAHRALGGIDAVIACAGVRARPQPTTELPTGDFDEVIDVNLRGVYFTVREAVPYLTATHGHLVLISSVSAITPAPGSAAYAVSKAGVRALGASIGKEHRDRFRVTTMILGATDTPMWLPTDKYPREKMLRPSEVARAIIAVLKTPWNVAVDEVTLLPRDAAVRPLGW